MGNGQFALATVSSLNFARIMVRRSNRRTIALLTAFLLLLCQAAFAAQLCAQQVAARADATFPSCHHAGEPENSTVPPTENSGGGCEAPALTGHAIDLPVLAVTGLPPLFIDSTAFATAVARAPDARLAEVHCRPPPLSILHCRFLI
jgi:hypothetical protein